MDTRRRARWTPGVTLRRCTIWVTVCLKAWIWRKKLWKLYLAKNKRPKLFICIASHCLNYDYFPTHCWVCTIVKCAIRLWLYIIDAGAWNTVLRKRRFKTLRVLMLIAHKISVHGAYLCILKWILKWKNVWIIDWTSEVAAAGKNIQILHDKSISQGLTWSPCFYVLSYNSPLCWRMTVSFQTTGKLFWKVLLSFLKLLSALCTISFTNVSRNINLWQRWSYVETLAPRCCWRGLKSRTLAIVLSWSLCTIWSVSSLPYTCFSQAKYISWSQNSQLLINHSSQYIIVNEAQSLYNELFFDTSLEVGKTLSKSERDTKCLSNEKVRNQVLGLAWNTIAQCIYKSKQ